MKLVKLGLTVCVTVAVTLSTSAQEASADIASQVEAMLAAPTSDTLRMRSAGDYWSFLSLSVFLGDDIIEVMKQEPLIKSGDEFKDRRDREELERSILDYGLELKKSFKAVEFHFHNIPTDVLEFDFSNNTQGVCISNIEVYPNPAAEHDWDTTLQVAWGGEISYDPNPCDQPNIDSGYGSVIGNNKRYPFAVNNVETGEKINRLLKSEGASASFLCGYTEAQNGNNIRCIPYAVRISTLSGKQVFYTLWTGNSWESQLIVPN